MEDLEEKEMMKFSWTGLFAVTSLCFFLFAFFIKLIDGSHISLFLKVGLVNLGFAGLCFINKWLSRKEAKKKPREISPIFQRD